MKKTWLTLILLFSFSLSGHAAGPVHLSDQAMEAVQQQVREMSALGVPESQAKKMLQQMVQNQFREENVVRAQRIVMEAAKAGLPTEPVMSKAMEGMAKQVMEPQVIQAMETVRSRYAYAHQLARSMVADEANLETLTRSMADGMAAGMKPKDLEALAEQVRTRQQSQTRNRYPCGCICR